MNNWLFLSVCGILFIGAIVGLARGALRIAVSLVATLFTMAVVFFATPYVSRAIVAMTPIDNIIEKQCLTAMQKVSLGDGNQDLGLTEAQVRSILDAAGVTEEELAAAGIRVEDIVNGKVSGEDLAKHGISAGVLQGYTSEQTQQSILDAEIPRQLQIVAIRGADIPEVFKDLLLANNNNEVYHSLGVTTFAEYVSTYLAKMIVDILAFLGTFLLVTIVVRAIVFALDFVAELPVLGALNRLAGMALGAGISLVVIGFVFVIITLLYTTEIGKMLMGMINENEFLTFLYKNNLIMKMMTIFR